MMMTDRDMIYIRVIKTLYFCSTFYDWNTCSLISLSARYIHKCYKGKSYINVIEIENVLK